MQAWLPADKLEHLKDLVMSISQKCSACLKLWQSLLGHLSFVCRVMSPGRPFLRHMFNILRGHTNPDHFIRIPSHVHSDCQLWKKFFIQFNGVSILAPLAPLDSARTQFYSDASVWGCTAVFGARWFQLQWSISWSQKHINVQEIIPLFLALTT